MDGDVGCLTLGAFSESHWGRGSEVWRRWAADGGWPPHGHGDKKVIGGGILASTHGKIPAERLPGLSVLVMTTPMGAVLPLGASPWAAPSWFIVAASWSLSQVGFLP
jgi:hypothetical protein